MNSKRGFGRRERMGGKNKQTTKELNGHKQ